MLPYRVAHTFSVPSSRQHSPSVSPFSRSCLSYRYVPRFPAQLPVVYHTHSRHLTAGSFSACTVHAVLVHTKTSSDWWKSFSFLDILQKYYNKLLDVCFKHPYYTVITGLAFIVVGIILMGKLPQNLMPTADRNQFAVEIYLPTGTAIEKRQP